MSRRASGRTLTGRALERHFARLLVQALDGASAELTDPSFDRLWGALEFRARDRDDAGLRRLADRILDHVENLTEPLGGRREAAFELLVRLGRVAEGTDPNLWRLEIDRPYPIELEQEGASLTLNTTGQDVSVSEVYTVDAASTFDRDDAFSFRVEGESLVLAVHVVHPCAAWRLDSALDLEARRRSASIYLPDGDAPMLPMSVCEGAWSMLEGVTRPVLTATARFGANAEQADVDISLGHVCVARALDYEAAEHCLAEQPGWQALERWTESRRALRLENGAAWAELPRARVEVRDGEMHLARSERDGPAHRLVAELNVWFNESIASFSANNGIPIPYRAQPAPSDRAALEAWSRHPDPIVSGVRMIEFMQGARTTFAPAEHSGLGVSCYAQASSPLRRYEDSLVHRQVGAWLSSGTALLTRDALEELCSDAEMAGRAARKAMRRSQDMWRLRYISASGTTERRVVVTHEAEAGGKARVVDLETMMAVRMKVDAAVAVGDELMAQVRRIDPRGGRFELEWSGDHAPTSA